MRPQSTASRHTGLGKPVKACTEVPASQNEEKLEHSRCAELISTTARVKAFQGEQLAETMSVDDSKPSDKRLIR